MGPFETMDTTRNDNWAQLEFGHADIGDKRLKQRLIKIAQAFGQQPSASIPKATGKWSESKATYNFFDNQRVNAKAMFSSHQKATLNRMAQHKVLLCVQDTTSLNYTTHPSTKGLGTIGSHSKNNIGIMVHDTMAFTTEGLALGVLDFQTWCRPEEEYGKRTTRKEKPIQDKESYKWLKSFQATQAVQAQLAETLLVHVADRESDIYEFFELASRDQTAAKVLIRANHNRLVDHPEKYLWDFMVNQKLSGTYSIQVPRKKNKPKRQALLSIRFASVMVKRPNNIATPNMPQTIAVWGILAEEENPPKNVEPICWLLLTTIPIETFEAAVEKIKWYMIRWQIELFHKVLKSACKTEERQLQSAEKLINCLTIDAIVAWRIVFLTKLGRDVPHLPCSVVFEEFEWKALYGFVHQTNKLPEKEPTLQEAIHMVAKLGGFLARRSDGHPGSITLYRGLIRLNDISTTWLIFSPQRASPQKLMGKG
jgi:hypothetical protein